MTWDVLPVTCRTALSRTGIPGHRYSLNPYTGCAHGCVYCYAPVVLRFSPVADEWGRAVHAKINVAEALGRELSRKRGPIGQVLLASVTDAYQPCEADFELTRSCLEVLSGRPDAGVSILTKSALVLRDVDLLARWLPVEKEAPGSLSVGFTVTTVDPDVSGVLEPGASSPQERLEAAETLVDEGFPVWIFVSPLLPGIGDGAEDLERLLEAVARSGVKAVSVDRLNPYARCVSALRKVYEERFPGALEALESYLHDPGAYFRVRKAVAGPLAAKMGLEIEFI